MSKIANAIAAWRRAIGRTHVRVDRGERTAAETATFPTHARIPAILRPGSTAEVQACIRIANSHSVPIYPVSTGKNWGYGSRVPTGPGAALMELGRMNRIVEYNAELAYITVEPGVTFQQAYDYLREHRSKLMLTLPSTTPHASLVGNALERGVGAGPYTDRFNHACALEVVLPTGECIHTGFDRFTGARAAHLYRYGVGPYLDGIFTQANLGVVTRMTFWLSPMPSHVAQFTFRVSDTRRLGPAVDALRQLALCQIAPPGSVRLWNLHRTAARVATRPKGRAGRALSPRAAGALVAGSQSGRKLGIGAWYGAGRLFAFSAAHARATSTIVRRALGNAVEGLTFQHFDVRHLETMPEIASLLTPEGQLRLDVPSTEPLGLHAWAKRRTPRGEVDPDRDRCGFIWLAPAVPFDGESVVDAASLVENTLTDSGFDPIVEILPLSERSIDMLTGIVYDREVAGDDARAVTCHDVLLGRLKAAGLFPYRLSHLAMDSLPRARDAYGTLLRRLKQALDPNDVLAPGRYDFRNEWPR